MTAHSEPKAMQSSMKSRHLPAFDEASSADTGTELPVCGFCSDADHGDWQTYVSASPDCGIYHHIGWKRVIEEAYGHQTFYLMTRAGGRVTGVLPLVMTRSRIFGSALTSLPFLDFAGVVADDDRSAQVLLDSAVELGRTHAVDQVELRQVKPLTTELPTSTHKVLMTLELDDDEDTVWSSLSSERRNRVRRALKAGLSVEEADASRLDEFYDIWTRNMRDLGSPPHSKRFFERVLAGFSGSSSLLMVCHEGSYIGAALALFSDSTMALPWVSSLRSHFKLYPNNILYWEAMRIAVRKGISIFDFGRSTDGSGTYEFKQRWGAAPTPLHWHCVSLANTPEMPAPSGGDSYQRAVEIWKRIPVPVTRWIGPALRKNITA